MTINEVRTLLRAEPFHPFVLRLADGRTVPASHPEVIAAAPSARSLVVYQSDDSFDVINLRLVTALEVRPNGQRADEGRHA